MFNIVKYKKDKHNILSLSLKESVQAQDGFAGGRRKSSLVDSRLCVTPDVIQPLPEQ